MTAEANFTMSSVRSRFRRGAGISLVVPFTPGLSEDRDKIWAWLQMYWRHNLPGATITMGHDLTHHLATEGHPFSKTTAVNDAVANSHGDIIVILDADAYVSHELILYCANEIRQARKRGRRLWFVPYRRFYRLSKSATEKILESDPKNPWHPDDPPLQTHLDHDHVANPKYGHHFMAMIAILPREGFKEVGGMDPRFNGWGGEDISFMRAMDTIYVNHKTVDHSVFHLFHGTIGYGIERQWIGQTQRMGFALLGARYQAAYGDRARMLRLIAEWRDPRSTPT